MAHVTLDQLPISRAVRRQIRDEPRIHGAVMDADTLVVWGPQMEIRSEAAALERLPDPTHAWTRERAAPVSGTRVQQAMALMQAEGITANAAAVRVGVDVAAVYRAIKLRSTRETCPTCGQVLP
jgi:hypothetical protein